MVVDAEGLKTLEAGFAPRVVKGRGVFSPLDRNPHAPWNLGGDKMGDDRNGYAANYARALEGRNPKVIVELGVFTGVSLAMWDALFPNAMIIGLDLDFSRFYEALPSLKASGAFSRRMPTLLTFDAYGPATPLTEHLRGLAVDFFVDDGPHTEDAIRHTLKNVGPLMAPSGLYVLEDFPGGARLLKEYLPKAHVVDAGRWSCAVCL